MMRLDFEKQNGLIPCIVQDVDTKKVLMLAYMNEESYKKTIETRKAEETRRSILILKYKEMKPYFCFSVRYFQ